MSQPSAAIRSGPGPACLFLAVVWCGIFVRHIAAQTELDLPGQTTVAGAVARVESAVVRIETIGGSGQVAGGRVSGQPATGTVIGRDGYIVTAAFNLAHKPTAIFVRFHDGRRFPAEIVATNHARQIVLLRVASARSLPVPGFVPRTAVRVGQAVIAVGRSLDASRPGVSTGIVSATERIWGKAIQTDAGVSPNNFGGPLIDIEGNVLGILVPMSPADAGPAAGTEWYDSGIGFAVPPDELRWKQLAAGTDLQSGLMGVSFREDRGYASPAEIATCPGNSPAARAGLRAGDTITRLAGTPIRRVAEVRHVLGPRYAGDRLPVEFVRGQETLQAEVELAGEIKPFLHPMIGVLLNPENAGAGAAIRHVISGSPAGQAGLQPGDVIRQVAGESVKNNRQLEQAVVRHDAGNRLELQVTRQEGPLTVALDTARLSAAPLKDSGKQDPARPGTVREIRIAEHANRCHAYIPDSDSPLGILLWIGEPGEVEPEQFLKPWKDWCEAHHFALIVPRSLDPKTWTPGEIEFLNKTVEWVQDRFECDWQRVAVGGFSTGGVMASRVAFSERQDYRGLVLLQSPVSRRLAGVQSEPGRRLMILLLTLDEEPRLQAEIETSRRELEAGGFPVHHQPFQPDQANAESGSTWQEFVMRWAAGINRF